MSSDPDQDAAVLKRWRERAKKKSVMLFLGEEALLLCDQIPLTKNGIEMVINALLRAAQAEAREQTKKEYGIVESE